MEIRTRCERVANGAVTRFACMQMFSIENIRVRLDERSQTAIDLIRNFSLSELMPLILSQSREYFTHKHRTDSPSVAFCLRN
jgi:hypothetical protein